MNDILFRKPEGYKNMNTSQTTKKTIKHKTLYDKCVIF
jgi:hypothetical protein